MPYDAEDHANLERRTQKVARGLVSCMNDTKWREVFLCASRHQLQFKVAWVRDPGWNAESLHRIRESLIDNHGLRDPGIGGPCSYRDILWIRFPFSIHNAYYGQVPWGQPIEKLLEDLASLGSLPVRQTQEYLEIRGYEYGAA
jgi:hypothetical protein